MSENLNSFSSQKKQEEHLSYILAEYSENQKKSIFKQPKKAYRRIIKESKNLNQVHQQLFKQRPMQLNSSSFSSNYFLSSTDLQGSFHTVKSTVKPALSIRNLSLDGTETPILKRRASIQIQRRNKISPQVETHLQVQPPVQKLSTLINLNKKQSFTSIFHAQDLFSNQKLEKPLPITSKNWNKPQQTRFAKRPKSYKDSQKNYISLKIRLQKSRRLSVQTRKKPQILDLQQSMELNLPSRLRSSKKLIPWVFNPFGYQNFSKPVFDFPSQAKLYKTVMDADIVQGMECVKGKQQVKDSRGLIERLKRSTWEEVTQFRMQADDGENKRRQVEEKRRMNRFQTIREETIQSSTNNEAAQIRWNDLLELEDCEELFEKIQEQKIECLKILDTKNNLIKEFLEELKEKDGFYVEALRSQENNIDKMVTMMRNQYDNMRDEYAKQLQAIEDAFLAQRSQLLKANRYAVDQLFRRHRELEDKYTNDRQTMEQNNTDQLENRKDEDANNLHKTKVLVQTNLQTLQTYMEEMKAVYQLNLEKLQYNVRILQQRANQNTTTLNQFTRRKRNLKNTYLALMTNVEIKQEKFMKTNAQLTDKFKKMSKSFNQLRKKFRHFEKADTLRFNQIWAMNEEEVKELASKVLKCDKIVYQQQLGLPWSPPEDTVLNIDIGSLSEGVSSKQKQDSVSKQSPSQMQLPMNKIKQVFEMLVRECSFLLQDKVRDQCVGISENEQFTLKIDSIRKTIGVQTMEDVQVIVNLFYDRSAGRRDQLYQSDQEDQEPKDPDELNVDPDQVIDILMDFQDYKNQRGQGASTTKHQPSVFTMPSLAGDSEKERRQKVLLEEKRHWEKLGGVLPDRHLRVWRALEKSLQQYYGLLQERQNLVEETGILHQQNEELKSLLQQYLQAGVNQELQVPPTQMLRIGDEEQED